MANEVEAQSQSPAVHGRSPPPRVAMPQRGVFVGFAWSGAEGAGNQILAAKVECSGERARLAKVWRPFQDAPGRRDVRDRLAGWLVDESRWAEGRLTVGVDFPLSLAETHLRQLGLLRQGLRGPAVLGQSLEERCLPAGADFTEGAEAFRESLGKDRGRLADCYRAAPQAPTSPRAYRRTFFGLVSLAGIDAAFPPWDSPQAGKPTVVEVMPAHVARALAGICSYADDPRDGVDRSSVRATLLRTLRNASRLEFEMEQAAQIIEDEEAFALEAVMGAVGAAAAQEEGFVGVPANVPRSEGWVYSVREEPWRGG